jgi:hypothetical protein
MKQISAGEYSGAAVLNRKYRGFSFQIYDALSQTGYVRDEF